MGLDSLMAIELKGRLERLVTTTLPPTLAFKYPTVSALADFLETTVACRAQAVEAVDDASKLLGKLTEMSGKEVIATEQADG